MIDWASAIGVVVAVGTIIFGALGLRGKVRKDYVELLQHEVELLRRRADDCEQEQRRLRGENDWLRQRLMHDKDH